MYPTCAVTTCACRESHYISLYTVCVVMCTQVFSMFLPDVNLRRTCAWYKESDPEDLSLDDSQVGV